MDVSTGILPLGRPSVTVTVCICGLWPSAIQSPDYKQGIVRHRALVEHQLELHLRNPDRGMAPTSPNANPTTTLAMKLLVDTERQRVLYAEASKDVVDFLFSLLALPVGAAVELLGKESMAGCVGNVYASVETSTTPASSPARPWTRSSTPPRRLKVIGWSNLKGGRGELVTLKI